MLETMLFKLAHLPKGVVVYLMWQQHLKTSSETSDKQTTFSAANFGQKWESVIVDDTFHKISDELNGGVQSEKPGVIRGLSRLIKLYSTSILVH